MRSGITKTCSGFVVGFDMTFYTKKQYIFYYFISPLSLFLEYHILKRPKNELNTHQEIMVEVRHLKLSQ